MTQGLHVDLQVTTAPLSWGSSSASVGPSCSSPCASGSFCPEALVGSRLPRGSCGPCSCGRTSISWKADTSSLQQGSVLHSITTGALLRGPASSVRAKRTLMRVKAGVSGWFFPRSFVPFLSTAMPAGLSPRGGRGPPGGGACRSLRDVVRSIGLLGQTGTIYLVM